MGVLCVCARVCACVCARAHVCARVYACVCVSMCMRALVCVCGPPARAGSRGKDARRQGREEGGCGGWGGVSGRQIGRSGRQQGSRGSQRCTWGQAAGYVKGGLPGPVGVVERISLILSVDMFVAACCECEREAHAQLEPPAAAQHRGGAPCWRPPLLEQDWSGSSCTALLQRCLCFTSPSPTRAPYGLGTACSHVEVAPTASDN